MYLTSRGDRLSVTKLLTKSRADVFLKFVEAIEALGGRVHPTQVHDDPLEVDVSSQHEARAEALMRALRRDLDALGPS
jgi:hypothetical protein